MGTRCKVRCLNTRQLASSVWDGKVSVPAIIHEAQFSAVIDGSDENKQFFASTPSLVLSVGTTREGHFEAGKSYYLDFTPAD